MSLTPSTIGQSAGRSRVLACDPSDRPTTELRPDLIRVSSRYELVRKLGSGGVGVVHEAVDTERGHRVALKTLTRLDSELLYRFKREFRSICDLRHPNLAALYDLVADQDECFFTMEYVDGVDFTGWARPTGRRRGGPADAVGGFDGKRLRDALRQLARGVKFLHDNEKLHRDLKAENVLVESDGRVVLLDFGMAVDRDRDDERLSIDGSLRGTPAFMAPEQAAGGEATEASDWYAFGVMLFECLTGRLPFEGAPMEILSNKQAEPAPRLDCSENRDLCDLCHALLERHPEDRPTGTEVIEALGVEDPPAVSHSGSRQLLDTDLVGRDVQLSELQAALEATNQGDPVAVVVHGRSGTGKTALVRAFLQHVRERDDAVVLTGRCYENEVLPYRAIDGIVDSLGRYLRRLDGIRLQELAPRNLRELAEVFPVLRELVDRAGTHNSKPIPLDEHELRRRAFSGLKDLLGRIADRHPLVLFVDDLQWGDPEGVRRLRQLLSPPDSPPALLVASYRSEPGSNPLLEAFLDADTAAARPVEIELQTLEIDQAAELAETILQESPYRTGELVDAIARESAGLPLFVHQLCRSVAEGHHGSRSDTLQPITLDGVILKTLGNLSPEARLLCELVAIAGGAVREDIILGASELGPDHRATINLLTARRLLRHRDTTHGTELEPYHDRIREALLRALPAEERHARHMALANFMGRDPDADPERVALHWFGGGRPEVAAFFAELAGDRAAERLAADRAVRLYRNALDWSDDTTGGAARLRAKLAQALEGTGRSAEAAAVYEEAAAELDPGDALELRRRAAMNLLLSGQLTRGVEVLRGVLKTLRLPWAKGGIATFLATAVLFVALKIRGTKFRERREEEISPVLLARVDACDAAAVGLAITDPLPASYYILKRVFLALRAGEPRRAGQALLDLAAFVASMGTKHLPEAEVLVDRAKAVGRRLEDQLLVANADLAHGFALGTVARWNDSVQVMTRAESAIRAHSKDVAYSLTAVHPMLTMSTFMRGRIADLHHLTARRIHEARETGDLRSLVHSGVMAGIVELAGNRPAQASQTINDAIDAWAVPGFHLEHFMALFCRFHVDLYRGETSTPRLEAAEPAVRESMLLQLEIIRLMWFQMVGSSALAQIETCRRETRPYLLRKANAASARLRRDGTPAAHGIAACISACVSRADGNDAVARNRLHEAQRAFSDAGMALHESLTLVALAARGDGDLPTALSKTKDLGVEAPENWARTLLPTFFQPSTKERED